MAGKPTRKNVIISFRIANVAGIGTFSGTLRYLRTVANWNVRLFTAQSELSPDAVASAEKDGIDGILTDHPLHENLAEALVRSEVPLVSIGNTDDRLFGRRKNIAFLEIDNRAIGEAGARHFLSLGRFRSFGFLPDSPPSRWSRMRLRGFTTELRKHGWPVDVFQSTESRSGEPYRTALSEWLGKLQRPAAVMLAGDYHALDVSVACAATKLSIPGDVAILGVDNDPTICETASPSLSSIEPQFEEEGFEAAHLLDKMMRSRKPSNRPQIVRFPSKRIVERDSTAFVSPGTRIIDRAQEFINANCCSPISARDVAAKLGVSPTLLALRFQQYEHTTVRETIIRARLRHVDKLLRTTSLPITRIASQCGFSTANRLTHLFTARYGMPPLAYRSSGTRDSGKRSPDR